MRKPCAAPRTNRRASATRNRELRADEAGRRPTCYSTARVTLLQVIEWMEQ